MTRATRSLFVRLLLAALACAWVLVPAQAERIKDLANFQGVRNNQLVGYGIVVGLDGTGDQTTQTPFTVQSIAAMLTQLGVNLPAGTSLQLKNVAAVMVTTDLPPFAQPGQTLDITVSSLGNAKSLRGGTLLMTPLKGADGQIYAIAQGNMVVGGAGASSGGSKTVVNHLSAGRISDGATVERAVPTLLAAGGMINLELKHADFTTARRVVEAVNANTAPGTAVARDARVVQLHVPEDADARVAFLSEIEAINVERAQTVAKVIINARTGSVVMNQSVTLERCAIAHGNLSVVVKSEPVVSQPNPLSQGQTVVGEKSDIEIKKDKGELVELQGSASLSDVVKALNAIGATPQDLLAILQAMKAAGALRADLEII